MIFIHWILQFIDLLVRIIFMCFSFFPADHHTAGFVSYIWRCFMNDYRKAIVLFLQEVQENVPALSRAAA